MIFKEFVAHSGLSGVGECNYTQGLEIKINDWRDGFSLGWVSAKRDRNRKKNNQFDKFMTSEITLTVVVIFFKGLQFYPWSLLIQTTMEAK